jgi:hypothetical protein
MSEIRIQVWREASETEVVTETGAVQVVARGGGGGAAQGSRLSVRAGTGEDRMVRGVDQ